MSPERVTYRNGDSFLHRLHPLSKGAWLLFGTALVFAIRSPWLVAAAVGLLLLGFPVAGVQLRSVRGTRLFVTTALLLGLLQAVFVDQGAVLLEIGPLTVTAGGVEAGIYVAGRFLSVVLLSYLFVLTTEPNDLAYALMRAGLPYRYGFALITALRLVPAFEQEGQTVYNAQLARGVQYDVRSPRRFLALARQFVLPLLVSALGRVDAMAVSMEGRCFGKYPSRTFLREVRATWRDAAAVGVLVLVLLLCLAGCGQAWEATVVASDGSDFPVDRTVLDGFAEFAEEEQGVPLERVLWTAGHCAIDRLSVTGSEGAIHEFEWAAVAEDAVWLEDGQITIGAEAYPVSRLVVEPPQLLSQVDANITDIAPTVAAALGLPAPAQANGSVLEAPDTDHVLLLFLDGFGYARYTEALDAGLIPNLAAVGEPLVGLTEYPPSTRVGTAALLSGAPPQVNGVDGRSVRSTASETIFDVAAAAGLEVVAVEGEALAFNLRGAEVQLSGDRDGNGGTDDNVLANALNVLDAGMPELFFVHFHGIDDAGHTYGPGTPEEEAVIREVDAAVGQLLKSLPADTLVIIFADHGMHQVEGQARSGNHGNLIERDMFIPIWVVGK